MRNNNYNIKFNIGEFVYLVTDIDQLERIVTEIWIKPDGIKYNLMQGITESWHYNFEITRERNIIKATSS